jgi:hypothetical protein
MATAGGAGGGMATAGGAGGGTTSSVTFTQIYTQVISQRCSPCHTTAEGIGVTQGMLNMTTQALAYQNLVNQPTAGVACAGVGTRIVPGNHNASAMYLKVAPDLPAPCGSKMPLGLPPITADQAAALASWIDSGAPNN